MINASGKLMIYKNLDLNNNNNIMIHVSRKYEIDNIVSMRKKQTKYTKLISLQCI